MQMTRHDPNSLSNDDVQAIYQDAQGVLWIGTSGGGLNRFDRQADQFQPLPARFQ